jgi:small subunit ribosomal protein S7
MSRRHSAEKRVIIADPKYNSLTLAKFINCLMLDGRKSTSRKIVYGAFEIVEEKLSKSAIEVFDEALLAVEPQMEVKSRRVGGSTYQVPIDVAPRRAKALSIRWIVNAVRKRNEKTMVLRLATELIAISQGKSESLKTRENVHKMAEANKAFAHFRW